MREQMEFKFTPENLSKIEAERKKYPTPLAAVMGTLWIAQKQNGYISNEVISEIARILDIDKVSVMGVVTFYTMYFQKPMGKHHIQVCTNVSCMLRGGYEIFKAVSEELGIGHLEVTKDGKFSLEEVECMGACGGAPMIAIDEDYYENIDKEKVIELIKSLA